MMLLRRRGGVLATIRSMSTRSLLDIYQDAVASKEIVEDPVQLHALRHLQALQDQLVATPLPPPPSVVAPADRSPSLWDRFRSTVAPSSSAASNPQRGNVPKGVYLYGGVGCGKTFLMDMFFDNLPLQSKRRVHFHKFMLEVHANMHQLRKEGHVGDPIPHLTAELMQTSRVLCFDEFQVTDVADALILRRLFSAMIDAGSIVVATSNRPPTDLYNNGIQRDLFVPFIDLLQTSCIVHSLEASSTDYRKLKGQAQLHEMYRHPLNDANHRLFYESFKTLANNETIRSMKLRTQGRVVDVPHAAPKHNVCLLSFTDVCDKPLGAADYLAIAEAFHTVFLQDIPRMHVQYVNQTRRFITFVDCMYDKKVQLYCLADAAPNDLVVPDESTKNVIDEAFAFDRTVSRLLEMQSESYGTLSAAMDLPSTTHRLAFLRTLQPKKQLNYLDVKSLWDMYNPNRGAELERHEVQVLVEDILELQDGARGVNPARLEPLFSVQDSLAFARFQRLLTHTESDASWWHLSHDLDARVAQLDDNGQEKVPQEVTNWVV
ncbi:hypothetical protein H310_11598 [Aphanomyces invadans]|uniref:AFG1-like ATPase n=1 Tax=Aphanomyces invadans TaxID=157072 RepID=A0A024TLE4_9STRA|nr:hypothetical protein H310_11598 [Aphanomyces invadans]ETV94955.1 hypothetical protein H310_11598 [Aphanomyces invadans]|eukprot:XP_008876546.1 hypothetical protein H310_11598 [Aphanomyces invadans]